MLRSLYIRPSLAAFVRYHFTFLRDISEFFVAVADFTETWEVPTSALQARGEDVMATEQQVNKPSVRQQPLNNFSPWKTNTHHAETRSKATVCSCDSTVNNGPHWKWLPLPQAQSVWRKGRFRTHNNPPSWWEHRQGSELGPTVL